MPSGEPIGPIMAVLAMPRQGGLDPHQNATGISLISITRK
jgi:hypothetical protein